MCLFGWRNTPTAGLFKLSAAHSRRGTMFLRLSGSSRRNWSRYRIAAWRLFAECPAKCLLNSILPRVTET